jgi:hypothetical protein
MHVGSSCRFHLPYKETKMATRIIAFAALLLTLLLAHTAQAQSEQAKLIASDAAVYDRFGTAVTIEGTTLLVGSPYDDVGNCFVDCGSVYVFTGSGSNWSEQAHLTAADASRSDYFGFALDLAGDTAVIGAFGADCSEGFDCGAAYIFTHSDTGWTQQAKVIASDAAYATFFGSAVAIDGDTILVGAPGSDCAAGEDCGAVYVFTRTDSGWVEQAKLTAANAAGSDFFGSAIALDGTTIVVGAYGVNCAAGTECGAAYLFTGSGSNWSEQGQLVASDVTVDDQFGSAVAIEGGTAVVGARGSGCCGAAYVFTGSGASWSQQAKLTAADTTGDDYLGVSVALSGDTIVVGASRHDCPAGSNCGAAYLFSGAGWNEQTKLTAADPDGEGELGAAVAIDEAAVVVGAPGTTCAAGPACGAVYLFSDADPGSSQEAIAAIASDVQTLIDAGALHPGQGNALLNKLNQAITKLDQGHPQTAANQLQAFINQVNAFIAAGLLAPAEGQPLIEAANEVIASLP